MIDPPILHWEPSRWIPEEFEDPIKDVFATKVDEEALSMEVHVMGQLGCTSGHNILELCVEHPDGRGSSPT
jgi:hypothetical protein